jgi:uroporphyrin-3 C-methyltransferase
MTYHLLSDQSRQRGSALPWLLIMLLLVVAVGGGWYGWQFAAQLADERSALMAELGRLTVAQQQQREQYDDQVALLAERLNGIDRMFEERDRQLTAMQEGGMRRWLVGEAEALASLAGERLLLTADLKATRRLLEGADATLARISDPKVMAARRALATDIEAVRGAEQVDVPALVLRLAALQALVAELAVPALPAAAPVAEDALPAEADWWQRLLHSMPVHIQRDPIGAPLPLDAQQAALLRLSLDNSLQQAQLALLQARPQVYQAALDQADAVIRSRFDAGEARARHLLSSINELRQQAVEQALPEIGAGLAAIRALKVGSEE